MKLELSSHKDAIILYDLQAQVYIRRSGNLIQVGNFIGGLEDLEKLRKFVDELNKSYLDPRFVEHLCRARNYCVKQLEMRAPVEHSGVQGFRS